jgi:hypothetical protein
MRMGKTEEVLKGQFPKKATERANIPGRPYGQRQVKWKDVSCP